MSQWVQHKNGGEKFELLGKDDLEFTYEVSSARHVSYSLPKSEYRPCDPPEIWEDVTEECEFSPTFNKGALMHYGNGSERVTLMIAELFKKDDGYRLRKIHLLGFPPGPPNEWAFVVERKSAMTDIEGGWVLLGASSQRKDYAMNWKTFLLAVVVGVLLIAGWVFLVVDTTVVKVGP